jgi:hypothetical protein
MRAVRALLTSRTSFLVGLALGMVGLRVLTFDHRYFALEIAPNHDMHQGLPFFCTSLHSVRLTGEIAWWSPMAENGYAQYYQSFFSPLAPTPHHFSFITWAQLVRALAWAGVALPEYPQYLVVNFLVLPFLAELAFAAFAAQLFRRRSTILLVSLVWTLSGVGLWHSAWFYFQEPFSLYLLLAAALAALRRPTARRLLLLLAAGVLQATSVNYWTVYNLFFVAILLGTYACVHPTQFRRLARRARGLAARHRAAASVLFLGLLALGAVWAVLLGSILKEQHALHVRYNEGEFTTKQAAERTQPLWTYTVGLFSSALPRGPSPDEPPNVQHAARYLGCPLLPLLALLAVRRWGRRERWLLLSAGGTLAVCLAPPLLLALWKWIPTMDRVRHLFYFYTHYWQTLLILLAGTTLEHLLREGRAKADRRRSRWLLGGLCGALGLVLLVHGCFWHLFPGGDLNVQAALHFAVLTLVAAAPMLQVLCAPTPRSRTVLVVLLTGLLLTDLSKYFAEVCRIDSEHTSRHGTARSSPLSPEARAKVRQPWRDPNPDAGFEGGVVANLPVYGMFWPLNTFLCPPTLSELRDHAPKLYQRAVCGPPLAFSDSVRLVKTVAEAERLAKAEPALLAGNRVLLVQDVPAGSPSGAGAPGGPGLTYRCRKWGYNGFQFELTAPRDGWIYIRQARDPLWRVTVDGQRAHPVRAELLGMALPVRAGPHVLQMDYRPLARRLYWPACFLLEGAVALLLVGALRARPRGAPALGVAPRLKDVAFPQAAPRAA